MEIQELLKKINQCMDDLDLVTARRHIEENIELLKENKHHLRSNARALFEFLTNNTGVVVSPLNRGEMNVISSINTHATNFDLRGLKLSIKNNADLLLREDVKQYFNADAKTLLEGMNVIHKDE